MKTGSTLMEVATELERQVAEKRDFVAPTQQLEMKHDKEMHLTNGDHTILRVNGKGEFNITDVAHGQIAARLGIPQKYYDRLRTESPSLLATNVNHWFQSKPESRMVRTLDGKARAFLSDRFRPLDNHDLAEAVLPTIQASGCRIESIALTETRLYIKAVTERITAEIKRGDVVQAGIVISNSEVGMGSVKVEPLVFRLVCSNGLIANDYSMSKYHVGRGFEGGDNAEEFFTDETRRTDDKAFFLKVRDVVKGAFNKDVFSRIVDKLHLSTEQTIDADPVKVVEVVQKRFGLSDGERSGVLTHLIKGGDLSQYGLLNAVTRMSQDVESYDRATLIEGLGGQILELPKHEWEMIANAKSN